MLAEIEDALVARIKTLQYVRAVESYGGQLDDETFEVLRVVPAIWVTFGGSSKPEQSGPKKFLTPATFVVMCAARSVRNERSTRHGGPGNEVGVYQMLEDVRQLLLMQDLGLAIDHFRPGAVRTLYNTRLRGSALAVFAQEWHTKYVEKPPTDGWQFQSVDLQYRLKPGDDKTDANDVVILPT